MTQRAAVAPRRLGICVTTLHIFRSDTDEQVREIVREITAGETTQIALYEEVVDYDRLVDEIFGHDRAICWW
jgi:hypothetical protein